MDDGAKDSGTMGPGMEGFFAGVMVGAAVAGIAALLYAPRSGKETRDRLRAELQETQNMFQCWSDDIKTRVESLSEVVRSCVAREAQPTGDGQNSPQ